MPLPYGSVELNRLSGSHAPGLHHDNERVRTGAEETCSPVQYRTPAREKPSSEFRTRDVSLRDPMVRHPVCQLAEQSTPVSATRATAPKFDPGGSTRQAAVMSSSHLCARVCFDMREKRVPCAGLQC